MNKLNVVAPLYGWVGYAVLSRNFLPELNQHVPLTVYPDTTNRQGFRLSHELHQIVKRPWYIPENMPALRIGQPLQLNECRGSPSIGYTVFEGTSFPSEEQSGLENVDVLWVPSTWAKDVVQNVGIPESTVSVIPLGHNPDIFHPDHTPLEKLDTPNRFTFLSVGKWERRKGHEELIQVFLETFQNDNDVELLICADNPYRDITAKEQLQTYNLPDEPRIQGVSPLKTSVDMARLYNTVDAFVLMSRAEGWGLPVMEAMACGLPAITTDYSAMTDYVSDEYAFPIAPRGMEVINDPDSYPRGEEHGKWAVPDFNQFSKVMQVVKSNPEKARTLGRKASKIMHRNWGWSRAARKAHRDLKKRGFI